ncbi:MAG: peptidase C11 [Clostridium sp.]|nr:peptidase C11 [Clostridium sp.]
MAMNNRPVGHGKNVGSVSVNVHKRGDGLGTGKVGSGSYSGGNPSHGGGGPQRSGGGGLMKLIIGALILLLGGGGGMSMLNGTGSSGTQQVPQQTQSPYTAPAAQSQTAQSSSGAGYSSAYGFDMDMLTGLFGSDAYGMTGTSSASWNGLDDNTGSLNESVAPGSRNKFTKIKGNNQDTVTIMVYMCGTDLESRSSMATYDLQEMQNATLSDNVNIIVYTGGCKSWRNNFISERRNQVYRFSSRGLERLVDDDGDRVMTDPQTLTRFIKFCQSNFPANRNELIFWDHGGGSVTGYGYDEKHASSGAMNLAAINSALKNAGMKFDFIGFDACLMATAENALMLSDYADYLVASEETEPGVGWYYSNWLTELSRNTSMPTAQIGKKIADDFVAVCNQKCRGQATTLSVVDLAELSNTMPKKLSQFSQDASSMITSSEFQTVSSARNSAREFARSSKIDQVDLVDFAQRVGTDSAKELAEAILGAVKYNRTSSNMPNSYGLSIYFPQKNKKYLSTMLNTYEAIGMDEDYSDCLRAFATYQGAGQASGQYYGGSTSPYGGLSGSGYGSQQVSMEELFSLFMGGSGVYDRAISPESMQQYITTNQFDANQLVWSEKGDGTHTLHLSEDMWSKVSRLDLNTFYDDGEGYIDLGLDTTFSFDENGDLIGETDGSILTLNGQPVSFYHTETILEEDGTSTVMGYVPAFLNGERVKLLLTWDNGKNSFVISGAVFDYNEGETELVAKSVTQTDFDTAMTDEEKDPEEGLKSVPEAPEFALKDGDKLEFICDYYTYDGEYQDSYLLGDPVTISGEPVIEYLMPDAGSLRLMYKFTDLYENEFWTPALTQ